MILPWIYDYNTKRLTLTVNDELFYEVFRGGVDGYLKIYKNQEFRLLPEDWENEKSWISDNYSDKYGKYEPRRGEFIKLSNGSTIECQNGFCPEGTRLDHLQRPGAVMLSQDMAEIFVKRLSVYETPDNGKTIYYRCSIHGSKTRYSESHVSKNLSNLWIEVPQPCAMQYEIQGRQLSSYEDLSEAGCPEHIVELCRSGQWNDAPRPELQKLYVYPTQ